MIKIFLVDDHRVVRNGLKLLLETQDGFAVVGEASNGIEALERLAQTDDIPDIIVSDINMVGMDGFELLVQVTEKYPKSHVIVLSMVEDVQKIRQLIKLGAKGYLIKDVGYDELLYALQHVVNGSVYICGVMTQRLLNALDEVPFADEESTRRASAIDLSSREMEILQLISDGLTTKEISDQLFISKRTVEGHRQNLLTKVGAKNVAELIKFAVVNRLVR